MVESELRDVFPSAQRSVKPMEPRVQSSPWDIFTICIQRYDNAQNDLKCRPHARRGVFSFPHCKILSKWGKNHCQNLLVRLIGLLHIKVSYFGLVDYRFPYITVPGISRFVRLGILAGLAFLFLFQVFGFGTRGSLLIDPSFWLFVIDLVPTGGGFGRIALTFTASPGRRWFNYV